MTKIVPITDSVCPRRWNFVDVRLNTEEIRMCCHTKFKKINEGESLLNNGEFKQRRLEMLQGIRHSDCDYCWKLEDNGLPSERTSEVQKISWDKKLYDTLVNTDVTDLTIDHPVLDTNEVSITNLVLENTCDLKCSYCRNNYSSQWAVEDLNRKVISIETYRSLSKESEEWFLRDFWKIIGDQRDNIKMFGIAGGEPTITPNFYNTVDSLIGGELHSTVGNPVLFMFTNANTNEKYFEKLLQVIPKITERYEFRINVSIESIESRAEYVRYGIDWTRFNSNVGRLLEIAVNNPKLSVIMAPTLSVLSLPRLDTFIEWVLTKERLYGLKIPFHKNTVKSPVHDRPEFLPEEFKQYLDKPIQLLRESGYNHDNYIGYLESVRDSINTHPRTKSEEQAFYDFYKNYDSIRNTNFTETFPELAEYYNACNTIIK